MDNSCHNIYIYSKLSQKRSKIECFKVIHKSLDNFNKKFIIEAVNDTFNEIQHLKSEASILDKDKYSNM